MVQTTFNFDSGGLPENPFTPGTQNHTLYEWLKERKRITRREVHHILFQDLARLRTDVKPYLRSHGFDIVCKPLGDGDTEYRVV